MNDAHGYDRVPIYVVFDCGGEREDAWDLPHMAFSDRADAERCAEERSEHPELVGLMWDYSGSCVKCIDLARPTCTMDMTDEFDTRCGTVRVWECSVCGGTCEEVNGSYEFCPHCGAKVMDE